MNLLLSNTMPLLTPYEEKLLGTSYTLSYYRPEVGNWVALTTRKAGVYLPTGHTYQCEYMARLMERVHRCGKASGTDKMGWEFKVHWGWR